MLALYSTLSWDQNFNYKHQIDMDFQLTVRSIQNKKETDKLGVKTYSQQLLGTILFYELIFILIKFMNSSDNINSPFSL